MDKRSTILDTPGVVPGSVLACGTLLVYDYFCLLDQEVAYVWTAPWTLGTVLFYLNRYLPFIDTFLSLHLLLFVDSAEECTKKFTVVTWFIASGVIISEAILILRTYAIWSRERYILITLCISSAITFIPALVVTELEIKSLKYIPSNSPGCSLGSAGTIIIFAYILLAFSETTIAVLTGIKAYRHLRHSQSGWIAQLYREGLLFYAYLLSVSIANVLVPVLAPPEFDNWLATPQRVMHSVLTTRVLLLILKQRPSLSNTVQSLPRFAHPNGPPVMESFENEEISAQMSTAVSSTGNRTVQSEIEMEERGVGEK